VNLSAIIHERNPRKAMPIAITICKVSSIISSQVIYDPSADRSLTERSIGRIVAVTDVTCWAGADAIAFITARDASLRRNAWTTRTAVFRARASIMVARPHLPSYATATPAGLVLVARRVSFTTCEIPFKNFSCHWPLGHLVDAEVEQRENMAC